MVNQSKVSNMVRHAIWASFVPQMVENLPAVQEPSSISGMSRSLEEGNGYPF